jgi:SAM-dependent methyltransferase
VFSSMVCCGASDNPVSIYESEELEQLAVMHRYQEWIAQQYRPYLRGVVMELGAGIGTMAQKWIGGVERLHLVEPARNLFQQLQQRFGANPQVTLHNGKLEEIALLNRDLVPGSLDAVIMVNVLEHIEHDEATLYLIHRLLSHGGYLMMFVPAMPGLYGSLDERFGHYRRYTLAKLGALCRKVEYETVRLAHFDLFGVIPWWLVNRVLRCARVSPTMARLYDRCVVPIGQWLEKRITFPVGKNLVYVGRKARG